MKKELLIILDPAHGEETPGKRSPDGRHREYIWSRMRLKSIGKTLQELGYKVLWTNETDSEIGLTNRKNKASQLAKENANLVPFLISLHNDASGATDEWRMASGVSVWTSKGKTTSDIFADVFINKIPEWLPTAKQRIYSPAYMDRDFENNFTVLMGDYFAILIECLFQDNKEDVEKLENPVFQKSVEVWIVNSIEECNKYINNHK